MTDASHCPSELPSLEILRMGATQRSQYPPASEVRIEPFFSPHTKLFFAFFLTEVLLAPFFNHFFPEK